jgi:hypothetical protein
MQDENEEKEPCRKTKKSIKKQTNNQSLNIFDKPNFSSFKIGQVFPCEYIQLVDKMHIKCKIGEEVKRVNLNDLFTNDTLQWLSWQFRKAKVDKGSIKYAYDFVLNGYEKSTGLSYEQNGIGVDENLMLITKRKRNKKKRIYKNKMNTWNCLANALFFAFFSQDGKAMSCQFKLKWNVSFQTQLIKLYNQFSVSVIQGNLLPAKENCVLVYNVLTDLHATGFKNGEPDPNCKYYENEKNNYGEYMLIK